MGIFSRRKQPPQNVLEQAAASPSSRFNPTWAFTYERKRMPSPGTQNYAYENLGLAEFSPIGPAVVNRQQFRPLQPPAQYILQTYWYQGIGGIAQGTFYGTPLITAGENIEGQING
jgi:hypothetical protein